MIPSDGWDYLYIVVIGIEVKAGSGVMNGIVFIGNIGGGAIVIIVINPGCCMGNFIVGNRPVNPGRVVAIKMDPIPPDMVYSTTGNFKFGSCIGMGIEIHTAAVGFSDLIAGKYAIEYCVGIGNYCLYTYPAQLVDQAVGHRHCTHT